MKLRYAIVAIILMVLTGQASAAILVMSPNGTAVTKPTLAAAATAADTAGKTVVVTSPLTAAMSNISSASLSRWPADRKLRVEKGGVINNTTRFRFADGSSFEAGKHQVFGGSGAVLLHNAAKFALVEWWNGKADGVNDNAAAIEKAAAAHSEIKLGDGVYICNDADITTDVKITGVGRDTILRSTTGTNILKVKGTHASDYRRFILENVTLDGVNQANGVDGVELDAVIAVIDTVYVNGLDKAFNCTGGVLQSEFNRIYDYDPYGTYCNYVIYGDYSAAVTTLWRDSKIYNCNVRGNVSWIYVVGGANSTIDGIDVGDSTFYIGTSYGIRIAYAAWPIVTANHLFESDLDGIYISNSFYPTITGNLIGWTGQGASGGSGIKVDGNYQRTGATYPAFYHNSQVNIVGNNISRPGKHGIEIIDSVSYTITGNTVIEPNTAAIGAQFTAQAALTYDGINISGNAMGGTVSGNHVGFESSTYNHPETYLRRWRFGVYAAPTVLTTTIDHPEIYEVSAPSCAVRSFDPENSAKTNYSALYSPVATYYNRLHSTFNNWSKSGSVSVTENNAANVWGTANSASTATFTGVSALTYGVTESVAIGNYWWASVWMRSATGTIMNLRAYNETLDETHAVDRYVYVDSTWRRYWIQLPIKKVSTNPVFVVRNHEGTTKTVELARAMFNPGVILASYMQIRYGTAAPASGYWFVGDRVINIAPTVGQPKSWVCTVSGTPGTWVSEGNL